jgi:hypothetical protein
MKLRNVIGKGAFLLAAPALAAAMGANASAVAPVATSPSAQTSYVPKPIWASAYIPADCCVCRGTRRCCRMLHD